MVRRTRRPRAHLKPTIYDRPDPQTLHGLIGRTSVVIALKRRIEWSETCMMGPGKVAMTKRI